jgi:hypothetical protein
MRRGSKRNARAGHQQFAPVLPPWDTPFLSAAITVSIDDYVLRLTPRNSIA